MRRHTSRKAAGWAVALLTLLVATGTPARSDDTQLFRSEAGKPYVYIILDTSTSMNVKTGTNAWLPASGDDEDSKFRQVKEAMLEVFNGVYKQNGDLVHFGFATFNQDRLKLRGKHWLYRVTQVENPNSLDYPRVGDILTFGRHFSLGAGTVDGEAGSCTAPAVTGLTAADRTKLDRFAKLNPHDLDNDGDADSYDDTRLWIKSGSDTYRLDVARVDGQLGHQVGDTIKVRFTLRKKTASDVCPTASNPLDTTVELSYVTEFLMSDEGSTASNASAQLADCGLDNQGNPKEKDERTAGVGWTWQDASAVDTCGGRKPFSGRGWESNYDSLPLPAGVTGQDNVDPVCASCSYNLKFPNQLDPTYRPLDRGDMLPYHWSLTNRADFFRRLAPDWDEGADPTQLDYRAASYFRDAPREGLDYLELRDPDRRPLVPFGASPLVGAIVDFRCFYLGTDDQKCKVDEMPFGTGWDDLAKTQDFEFGCRKPFLIVVGDGEAHGNSNDATSAVANLKNIGLAKTWAIDYGGDCAKNGTYHSLTQSGDGECVSPQTKQELVSALRKIVGVIIEQTKAFSSAAVPTVQADVADRVFLSNFTPLNDEVAPAWPGHMNSFLKPVPLTTDGKPDTSATALCPTPEPGNEPTCVPVVPPAVDPCPTNSKCTSTKLGFRCVATGCFAWDAGAQLLTQYQSDPATQNGSSDNQRRVYYSEQAASGRWPAGRHYFQLRAYGDGKDAARFDFWSGLGLPFSTTEASDGSTNKTTEDTANEVVREELARKLADLNAKPTTSTADDTPFLLGDIFHSTPVVIGSPSNTLYFARDVPGYRDFSLKHQHRRKLLLVGANDGMLHGFDAGRFKSGPDRFTNGTGKEVFAFIPRSVLPTLRDLYAGSGENRTWSVDGTPTVADVYIDPLFSGTPSASRREWRTVAVSGLREGGVGYFALDVTQPDTLDSNNVPQPLGSAKFVPSCMGSDPAPTTPQPDEPCGPIPYPAQLWEFRDGIYVSALGRTVPFDEDGNGARDLAPGWSTPNLGRIRVIDTSGTEVDRYVAVFGGGLDKTERSGNWIYMVDMETGKAIYKQRLAGSVPAEPSAVDTDQDGYIERVYVGTTRGYVYRIDLRAADGSLPELTEVDLDATFSGTTYTERGERILGADFTPRVIFKAQADPATTAVPSRPIYYRISVIYIAKLNRYAIAFGTGDREDLFNFDNQTGRFYIFRDDIEVGDRTTFYTEADLKAIAPGDAPRPDSDDFITNVAITERGWFLTLDANERLITNPFALSGILVFTVFKPNPTPVESGNGNGGGNQGTLFCRRDGTSRIFGVTATNGNGLLLDAYGGVTRYQTIGDFVTDPYTEQAVTKNPPSSRRHADQFPTGSHLNEVLEDLKKLFPPNCKFGSYRVDVKTLSSDTGVIFIAPVPVCIIEKNWREF